MIQSVKRAFDILEYIANNGNLVRLNDIAVALELQNTTVHNFLQTLKELGYIEQDTLSPRYKVTSKFQSLSIPEVPLPLLKSRLRPLLEQITQITKETSYLAIQMGAYFRHELICEPERSVRISLELGKELAMQNTAIGKVFIAYSEHLQLNLKKSQDKDFGVALEREVTSILENGYALDLEQYEPDLNCVAVPYFENGKIVAVLAVSGPAYRFKIPEMLNAVQELYQLLTTVA